MFRQRTLPRTSLHSQDDFYAAFVQDMSRARKQPIIESLLITCNRVRSLLTVYKILRGRGVQIITNTYHP